MQLFNTPSTTIQSTISDGTTLIQILLTFQLNYKLVRGPLDLKKPCKPMKGYLMLKHFINVPSINRVTGFLFPNNETNMVSSSNHIHQTDIAACRATNKEHHWCYVLRVSQPKELIGYKDHHQHHNDSNDETAQCPLI